MNIKAYHGGCLEDATWYTTDRDHAAYFGDVHLVTIDVDSDSILDFDFENSDISDLDGYEADAALYELCAEWRETHSVVAITGWEGPGICYLVIDDCNVGIEETEEG